MPESGRPLMLTPMVFPAMSFLELRKSYDAAFHKLAGLGFAECRPSGFGLKDRGSKGAATRYDSPARSLPIALYMGQS